MTECDNNKVHISINFVLSICLIIMLDNLLLKPSLHCNTSLHFTTLHPTTLHLSTLPFLSFTLHYPLIWLNPVTFPTVLFHFALLNQTRYSSPLQTYFQNNGPLHCPKEALTINLQAPCVLFIGQAFRYSPENAFYLFNQQIYFII